MVVRDDLVSLRDFFKKGMQFSVVEEMVGSNLFIVLTSSALHFFEFCKKILHKKKQLCENG